MKPRRRSITSRYLEPSRSITYIPDQERGKSYLDLIRLRLPHWRPLLGKIDTSWLGHAFHRWRRRHGPTQTKYVQWQVKAALQRRCSSLEHDGCLNKVAEHSCLQAPPRFGRCSDGHCRCEKHIQKLFVIFRPASVHAALLQ